jgi:glucose-6-phosphate 1-epimerase
MNKSADKYVTATIGSSSIAVMLYGATVISWKVDGTEKLFLSEFAILDESKAIRGGMYS